MSQLRSQLRRFKFLWRAYLFLFFLINCSRLEAEESRDILENPRVFKTITGHDFKSFINSDSSEPPEADLFYLESPWALFLLTERSLLGLGLSYSYRDSPFFFEPSVDLQFSQIKNEDFGPKKKGDASLKIQKNFKIFRSLYGMLSLGSSGQWREKEEEDKTYKFQVVAFFSIDFEWRISRYFLKVQNKFYSFGQDFTVGAASKSSSGTSSPAVHLGVYL
ncbi:MAG: hypothetical protein KA436_09020 [Oligoflexales bacterium]|nr:hypothetical protein [Oligoflexales bacterium]